MPLALHRVGPWAVVANLQKAYSGPYPDPGRSECLRFRTDPCPSRDRRERDWSFHYRETDFHSANCGDFGKSGLQAFEWVRLLAWALSGEGTPSPLQTSPLPTPPDTPLAGWNLRAPAPVGTPGARAFHGVAFPRSIREGKNARPGTLRQDLGTQ